MRIDEQEELKEFETLASFDNEEEFDMDSVMDEEFKKEAEAKELEESKERCPFKYKDEVKLKSLIKKYKEVVGLKKGKVGRVVAIKDENAVQVDFWDTFPAKFTIETKHLELVTPAEEVSKRAAPVDPPKPVKSGLPKASNEHEAVAKPTRYNQGTIEVWDAIVGMDLPYMEGNVCKYVARHRHKNGMQDLHKALNYLIKVIANETGMDYYELRNLTIEEIVNGR